MIVPVYNIGIAALDRLELSPKVSAHENHSIIYFIKGWGSLTMSYFVNLDNEFLKIYKINLKNRKKIIYMLFYL
jgi:hypothetical protein